ncbi:MAG: YqgE/AlgH family protein [Bacteroidia bacterium]|nr:YqgE/AlgH family protein [Bacteroidia bacterium]
MRRNMPVPATGRILLSEPFMNDDYFRRSVVLLAKSEEKGSMGFIMNKPIGHNIHELINDFPEFNCPVYFGGPVESNSLFFIHTIPHLIETSFEIEDGIHFGGNFTKVKNLAGLGLIKPNQIRFFAGYSGWEEGQLDHEIDEDSWLIFNRPEKLLEMDPITLWGELLRHSKTELAIWSNYPDDPSLN